MSFDARLLGGPSRQTDRTLEALQRMINAKADAAKNRWALRSVGCGGEAFNLFDGQECFPAAGQRVLVDAQDGQITRLTDAVSGPGVIAGASAALAPDLAPSLAPPVLTAELV